MIELSLFGVQHRGVAGLERICIRALSPCNLGHFWVGLGVRRSGNMIFPINDNQYWLGNGYVSTGDWIFLYTGRGTPSISEVPNSENRIYTIYWDRDKILFGSPEVFPYLIKADNVILSDDMQSHAAISSD